ncbi:MAG TPA: DUF177 domain-containing protein [Candidatus Limnocylindrales bacterium]|nr:DUF177 domain-containing protein [Candidatus Limnocylindrales bacterium]
MIIRVPDLKEEVRQLEFFEPADELNTQVNASPGADDQHFCRDLAVVAEIYRTGHDVHFQGSIDGEVRETCARCLEEFERPLHREFRFVILPRVARDDDAEDDEGVDHYSGDDLDLSPLVREQALLSFESLPLCSEECMGLCAGCGANLNREKCTCPETGRVRPLRAIELPKV